MMAYKKFDYLKQSVYLTIFFVFINSNIYASEIVHPEINKQLIRMGKLDSKNRVGVLGSDSYSVRRNNTENLKKIIEKIGWPTVDLVGKYASQMAWLIVQHSDHDLEFQKKILKTLYPLVVKKQIEPRLYAYLYDRTHTPQKYGTQGHCKNGKWVPRDNLDFEQVETLREDFKMMPFKEYIEKGTDFLCNRNK